MSIRRRNLVLALVAAFVAIQLVPLPRTNPPVSGDFDGPAEVERVLRQSCYDCHSNETVWTWTAYVAPMSWLVVRDVHRARDEYNLSEWRHIDPGDRAKLPREIVEEVEDGAMPPALYLLAHPSARLSTVDLEVLRSWSRATAEEEGSGRRRRRRGRDD